MNADDLDGREQFCEWFQHKIQEDEELVGKIIWSNEATFNLNGTMNHHNRVCVLVSSGQHGHGLLVN
jgi:hypothetical protein